MGNCCSASSHFHLSPFTPSKRASNAGQSSRINNSPQAESHSFGSIENNIPDYDGAEGSLHVFSFGDLKAATRNFRMELGEGGFGIVYKGYIDEKTLMPSRPSQGITVAIKKLKENAQQGHREWLAEVRFLGALSHPNLVKLIGFCSEGRKRLLVYEYMSRGSLEKHLFRRGPQSITWDMRLKVAIGAARGLAFLHNSKHQVIYRDFKASNILLDGEYNAKLSDFGLAKNGPAGDASHVSTRVMGTNGYAAPEYLATGHLSTRSDVYSFGVVLLELLTGCRAVDSSRQHGQQKLVDWTKPYLRNRQLIVQIVDKSLENQFSHKQVEKVANISLQCLNVNVKARPSMKEILDSLEALTSSSQLEDLR